MRQKTCGLELHAKILDTFFNFLYCLGKRIGLRIFSCSDVFSGLEKLRSTVKKIIF